MPNPKNDAEAMAKAAAKRIDEARALDQQLTFLGDEDGAPPVDTVDRKAGRPPGAKNKGSSEIKDWLGARGYRMPEDVLAKMAGLDNRDGAIVATIKDAEQVAAWAFEGATVKSGDRKGETIEATPAQKLQIFSTLYTMRLRAADALMPYTAAKASPDETPQRPVTVVVAGGQAPASGPQMRDVTPENRPDLLPADVAWEIEQNQRVSKSDPDNSDG